MPLLADLSEELKNKVHDVPGDNIEHWMTYLSQTHPWLSESENLKNRARFLELTQEIRNILLQDTKTTMSTCPSCPPWLNKLILNCSKLKANIITLNYDTLVESAAKKLSSSNNLDDIYPIPLSLAYNRRITSVIPAYGKDHVNLALKLFKLHGSINWFYSGAYASTGETIYYIDVEQWEVSTKRKINSENETKEYLSDKVPLIVPPLLEKASYFQHETIRTVWRLAGQAIKSANRLICMGYSLPETDLSFRFFLEASAPESKIPLYVINLDTKSSTHYKKLLGDVYDVDDRFTGKAIDEKLISDLFATS